MIFAQKGLFRQFQQAWRCTSCPIIFTDEVSFVSALSGPQSVVDFNSSSTGPISGNEFTAQGFIFDSPLASPLGQLEIAPPSFFASSNYLNIDRRPFAPGDDGNEDDLEITIVGNWQAVGFRIIDGDNLSGESVTVFDQSGGVIHMTTSGPTSFFGIITDVPIGRVFVDEAAFDSDDVGYDNFRLGNAVNDADGDAAGCPLACVPPPSYMVSWWSGDSNANDIQDGNDGMLQGDTTFAAGKVDQAFSFDGSGDFVSVPDSTDWDFGSNDFSIDLWVKFDQIKDSMFIHQQSGSAVGGWEFDFQQSNGILVFARDPFNAAIIRPWSPQQSTWYHLAVTRTGFEYRIR
ncbi:MAG: hypothetical protein HYW01_06240 [Deltaproteobacteria bacterium]|nr:hypothetical protein [Deltaproteobacteria bacterium]